MNPGQTQFNPAMMRLGYAIGFSVRPQGRTGGLVRAQLGRRSPSDVPFFEERRVHLRHPHNRAATKVTVPQK